MKQPDHYIPVKGDDSLVRDSRSGAILNVNVQAFENYKRGREREGRINQSINDVEQLKGEIQEMKCLLELILEKLNK
jgi:hypothetical protein